jgi:hypothetical protein
MLAQAKMSCKLVRKLQYIIVKGLSWYQYLLRYVLLRKIYFFIRIGYKYIIDFWASLRYL